MKTPSQRYLPADCERQTLELLQADIDDESPERLGAVVDDLLAAGALDAVLVPVIMKKGRPGVRLDVLMHHEDRERLAALVLRETTTLGVRVFSAHRYALARRQQVVPAFDHPVRVKVALWNGKPLKAKPEADVVRRVAVLAKVSAREVEAEVRRRLDEPRTQAPTVDGQRKKRSLKPKPQ
jgi:uncharacterized protein (DUF111 family)